MTMYQRLISYVLSLFSFSAGSATPGDVEKIIQTAYERGGQGLITDATVGEPQMENYGTDAAPDQRVVIPLLTDRYESPPSLMFDVPDGPQDVDSDLFDFMQRFGVDVIDDLEGVVGESVPVALENNAVVAQWKELDNKVQVYENEHSSSASSDPVDTGDGVATDGGTVFDWQ